MGSTLLTWATESANDKTPLREMFRLTASRSRSPQSKRCGLQFSSHQSDDLAGRKSELHFDRIKSRTVFPRHPDDAIDLSCRKFFLVGHFRYH